MKNRSGFVSNSSSSSFVVSRHRLSERDVNLLLNYPGSEPDKYHDGWWIYVSESDSSIHGSTIMDNSDLSDYCKEHNIDTTHFEYEDY